MEAVRKRVKNKSNVAGVFFVFVVFCDGVVSGGIVNDEIVSGGTASGGIVSGGTVSGGIVSGTTVNGATVG